MIAYQNQEKKKNIINNDEEINFEQNYNSNYKCIYNSKNQNFIDNYNSLLISESSKSFKIDSESVEPVDGLFKKIIESTFYKFIN